MYSDGIPLRVGCPIRRSRDHRSLASPPGFSQRATSFIASQCQGIHQMPLLALEPAPNAARPTSCCRRMRRTTDRATRPALAERPRCQLQLPQLSTANSPLEDTIRKTPPACSPGRRRRFRARRTAGNAAPRPPRLGHTTYLSLTTSSSAHARRPPERGSPGTFFSRMSACYPLAPAPPGAGAATFMRDWLRKTRCRRLGAAACTRCWRCRWWR